MSRLSRRQMLTLLGAGAVGAAVAGLRPSTGGAPHPRYFADLARALKQAGIATPTLVIDRRQLHANVGRIMHNIGGRTQLRVVAKSLPCAALLDEVRQLTASRRLMVFNLPQLLLTARGPADILLGKPLPAAAAAAFYRQFRPDGFAPEHQLQWLIDTPARLAQYRELARAQQVTLRVNVEIDVGLHRGGVNDMQTMQDMLALLAREPRLQWAGLMGYDAHVAKIPDLPGLRQEARQHAQARYAAYAAAVRAHPAFAVAARGATYNAAGSPTYRLYDGSGVENELSVGSAMLKPSDFDTSLLADLAPAVYIATPVLKAPPRFMMPYGVEWLGEAASLWDANQQQAYFIYGGNWLADPVSPPGLAASSLYGTSSNQQVLTGSGRQRLAPDDIVFFRPRQSEAVLLQFGDIALYEEGRITQMWQPMPATA
ncbi:alanine racemase [Chitinivorax sp. PXF-14]|uniref:alanine racemase n=1 Tax=Chitinivorax sp. PXF-14 TaxID=3230488 RepID=UPI00346789D9